MPTSLPIVIDDGTENLKILAGRSPVPLNTDQSRYTTDDLRRIVEAVRGDGPAPRGYPTREAARTAVRAWLQGAASEVRLCVTWLESLANPNNPGTALSGAYKVDASGSRLVGIGAVQADTNPRVPKPEEATALIRLLNGRVTAMEKAATLLA